MSLHLAPLEFKPYASSTWFVAECDGYDVFCRCGHGVSGPYMVKEEDGAYSGDFDPLQLLIWRQNFELTRGSNQQESVT